MRLRGTAEAGTLTGDVQRRLSADWQTQGQISSALGGLHSVKASKLAAVLDRLVREGRAERWRDYPPDQMGARTLYRAPGAGALSEDGSFRPASAMGRGDDGKTHSYGPSSESAPALSEGGTPGSLPEDGVTAPPLSESVAMPLNGDGPGDAA